MSSAFPQHRRRTVVPAAGAQRVITCLEVLEEERIDPNAPPVAGGRP